MKKSKKVWIISAACCMVVGTTAVISAIVVSGFDPSQAATGGKASTPTWGGWDLSDFNTVSYETKTYTVKKAFSNLEVTTDWQDLSFLPAEDGVCRVECAENEDLTYTVKVEGDTLQVLQNDSSQWYDKIGFFFPENTQVTVYLPEQEYKRLSATTSSGNISVASGYTFASAKIKTASGEVAVRDKISGSLDAEASSGDIVIESFEGTSLTAVCTSGNMAVSGVKTQGKVSLQAVSGNVGLFSCNAAEVLTQCSSGDISVKDTQATGNMQVQTTSGNIVLSACDAKDIRIQTTSGDVSGSLLSKKRFSVQTSSGDVTVPDSLDAQEICQIITTSGNVSFVEK